MGCEAPGVNVCGVGGARCEENEKLLSFAGFVAGLKGSVVSGLWWPSPPHLLILVATEGRQAGRPPSPSRAGHCWRID